MPHIGMQRRPHATFYALGGNIMDVGIKSLPMLRRRRSGRGIQVRLMLWAKLLPHQRRNSASRSLRGSRAVGHGFVHPHPSGIDSVGRHMGGG